MSHVAALRSIDPHTYVPHELHRADRAWAESNCYIDVWIEVIYALGCDPHACLGFVMSLDWEGDQFTFFKPPHEDLFDLYGIEVQELTVYKPLVINAVEQLRSGKIVIAEADAFYLPDTASTDYRTQHTKTTIAIQEIDLEARELGYFHNSSYYALDGIDFTSLFRIGAAPDATFMPFFAEFVRASRVKHLAPPVLAARAVDLMKKHLARRPMDNPIERFASAFTRDLERLKDDGLGAYHVYAFATVRQLGSAFELAALMLRWLARHGEHGLESSVLAFDSVSTACKSLILKGARAVGAKKNVDVGELLGGIERNWAHAINGLAARYDV